MTDIKTVLTDEQKVQFVTDICEYGTGLVTPLFAIVDSIERAVLEAAPASSAMAMQAVDAELLRKYGKHLSDCLGGLSGLKRPCTCGFDAALQSQQSPVQASDSGRQE